MCKDKRRDVAWHGGRRTWHRVSEWLTEQLDEIKRRSQQDKDDLEDDYLSPRLDVQRAESKGRTNKNASLNGILIVCQQKKSRFLEGIRYQFALIISQDSVKNQRCHSPEISMHLANQ